MTEESWLISLKMQKHFNSPEQQDQHWGPPFFCLNAEWPLSLGMNQHKYEECVELISTTPPHECIVLTYSMVQSPSWEANWFAASQETPCISRNPKVHYRTHKRPPPISILGQPNPVHIPTSYLLEIHPNIIHPSTPRSPQWSLSLRFPHQDPIRPPLLTPYAPHAQPISFSSILST